MIALLFILRLLLQMENLSRGLPLSEELGALQNSYFSGGGIYLGLHLIAEGQKRWGKTGLLWEEIPKFGSTSVKWQYQDKGLSQ